MGQVLPLAGIAGRGWRPDLPQAPLPGVRVGQAREAVDAELHRRGSEGGAQRQDQQGKGRGMTRPGTGHSSSFSLLVLPLSAAFTASTMEFCIDGFSCLTDSYTRQGSLREIWTPSSSSDSSQRQNLSHESQVSFLIAPLLYSSMRTTSSFSLNRTERSS